MENTLHARMPGRSIFERSGWTYWTVCGRWVESIELASAGIGVTCVDCRDDLGLQAGGAPIMWADDLPDSPALLWLDPP